MRATLHLVTVLLRFITPLFAMSSLPAVSCPAPAVFSSREDIGATGISGATLYDDQAQTYTLTASGTNMWGKEDSFHFAHQRLSGDFVLQVRLRFEGKGVDPHRKAGILLRSNREPNSPHLNACVHGDGLTSLQFRRQAGAETEELRFDITGADVLELSRKGNTATMSAARYGETYASRTLDCSFLGDEVLGGIYVCAHNNTVIEKVVFDNVRVIRPAPANFVPYRDYIGSDLELLDVETGRRLAVHRVEDSLQAPNWTPDGRSLLCNRNGRIYRFDLRSRTMADVDTGIEVRNNNDHALSFDGRLLGISSGEISRVFVLPVGGGCPKLVTPEGPSYLHGFSPDGRHLLFTGGRNGNYDIYRIPAEGGREERLTEHPGLDDGSEYGREGRYIYFNSERSGRMQIWRMKADGSGQEQLTFDSFNNWFPHPSPDGKSLVILSYGPDIPAGDHPFYKHVTVRLMPIEGGTPKVIAYLYGGQGSINVNSWSPDSRRIAFISNSR